MKAIFLIVIFNRNW